MATLTYQGHGSFFIETEAGTVIYVDPYAGEGYDKPADLVLITHEHYDHNKLELVTLKPQGGVIRAADMLANGGHNAFAAKDVKIKSCEAENKNHPIDFGVGYLIYVDDKILYAAGDTSRTKEMEGMAALHIDWALLPCDGVYNMSAEEAGVCADLIKAAHAVPIHTKPGELFSEEVAARFQTAGKTVIFPGETVKL